MRTFASRLFCPLHPDGGCAVRRTTAIAAGILSAGAVGAAGWAVTGGSAQALPPSPGSVPTGARPIVRTDVADRVLLSGTLGHAGTYQVIAPAAGTLTRLPKLGQVVRRGQAIYETEGTPVMLMYGRRPVWRTFQLGMTDGPDVRQLQANLKALGCGAGLTVGPHFSYATVLAVRCWQLAAHLPVTGTVALGQVVFLPGAARVTGQDVTPGAPVQPGSPVEEASSTQPTVTVQVPSASVTVRVGDPAVVILPDGVTKRTGTITAVGAVASSASSTSGSGAGGSGSTNGSGAGGSSTSGGPSVQVTVTVHGTVSGFLDQAAVQVAITANVDKNVLAVPIVALRATSDGGYDVVVVGGGNARQVPVTVGLFDDIAGLAEISGPGLAAGQRVEVPAQ
jgi:peptidoglycan hydrolase-like protein with peptidoglycan-binding domain